jgi:hypothetical protein
MILLDMDGVLANFSLAASLVHGQGKARPTHWNWYEDWGITGKEFWAPIHELGGGFYKRWVQPYPWAVDVLRLVADADDFIIYSAPSSSEYGYSGKKAWIDKYLQPYHDKPIKIHVGSDKWLMAGKDRLLIDDYDENIKKFREHGGHTVTFPQPWNSQKEVEPGDLTYLRSFLHYWKTTRKEQGVFQHGRTPIKF